MVLYKKDYIIDRNHIFIISGTAEKAEPIHRHEFIELVYVLSGSGIHLINDKEYPVSHGNLLFIDYGQTHSFIPDPTITYVNIILEPEFFSKELVNVERITEIFCYNMFLEFSGQTENIRQCTLFQNEELSAVDNLIQTLLQEYRRKKQGYMSVLRAGTQMLFSWFLREMNSNTEIVINNSVQDVLEYINEHFAEKMNLYDIAAKGFYNPSYLSRLLKKSCGKSFSQYVKEKRISQSAGLIRTTKLAINDIMLQSGYTDSKLFYKHFKEICGKTPGAYRRGHS